MRLHEVQVVMELVNGDSLERHRQTDVEFIVEIFSKLAQGLDALHELGYIHADIKPNNVLVNTDGGIKIIDFGQSCPIGHRKQRIQGSADYIAPEQVERRPLTRETDVFNLGATLYWVLTGKAFPTLISKSNRDVHDISVRTPRRLIPTPQDLNPEIPSALSRLVMDACADRPTDRPRNMREVISRLEVVYHILEKRRAAGEKALTVPEVGEPLELDEGVDRVAGGGA
jgi:serine/threonine protein kinase